MKVLIVGGGIGGLALGAFLKKCAIDFDIIERAPNWDRRGYSLGIWDNGRDILAKLGLADFFDTEGERIKDYYVYNTRGVLIKRFNFSDFYSRYGSAYTHVNRSRLHSWLLQKVGSERVSMNTTLASFYEKGDKVCVALSQGGEREYDLVVGADGVHSQVRKLAFVSADVERFIQWRSWFFWTDNRFKKERGILQYAGDGRFLSIFDDKDKALCIAVAPAKHGEWDEEKGRAVRLASIFKRFTSLFPGLVEGVKDTDITPTDIATVHMNRWYRGRIVLLGDAAHAMEPYAGLGASMAMEDAYVLAGELMKVKEAYTLNDALARYEKVRQKRVRRARKANQDFHRWHKWLMSNSDLLSRIIEFVAPYVPTGTLTKEFHTLLTEEI